LETELDKAKKAAPGSHVTETSHVVTDKIKVDGPARPGGGCTPCPPCGQTPGGTQGSRGLTVPDTRLATLLGSLQNTEPAPAEPAKNRGTGRLVVGGEERTTNRAAGRPGTEPPPVADVCVLARNDEARILVDQVKLETEAGNKIMVGTAAVE